MERVASASLPLLFLIYSFSLIYIFFYILLFGMQNLHRPPANVAYTSCKCCIGRRAARYFFEYRFYYFFLFFLLQNVATFKIKHYLCGVVKQLELATTAIRYFSYENTKLIKRNAQARG